jgi:uncharacterized metal-binding protein
MSVLLYLGFMALVNLFTHVDSTGTLLRFSESVTGWVEAHPIWIAYGLVGLVLGGAIHTLSDLVYSWVKRGFRRLL